MYEKGDVSGFAKLTASGQATVYHGNLMPYGKICIKLFHQNTTELDKEIEILTQLSYHENIVKILGRFQDDSFERKGFVMEFMDGGCLANVIHSLKSYSATDMWNWFYQASLGLKYLHSKRILHNDLKPANMLLKNYNQVLKLCDFASAKRIDNTTRSHGATTKYYLAPERISCDDVDLQPYNDIYSLGIILWELIHRKTPYSVSEYSSLCRTVLSGGRPSIDLQKTDPDTAALIVSCWNSEPPIRPSIETIAKLFEKRANENLGILVVDTFGAFFFNATKFSWITMDFPTLTPTSNVVVDGQRYNYYAYEGLSVIDDTIYLIASSLVDVETNAFFKLDETMKWVRLSSMNSRRTAIWGSTLAHDGCIWVIGGNNLNEMRFKTVEKYDPKTNEWSVMKAMNSSRSHASATVFNGKFYVCGGSLNSQFLECYDPVKDWWTELIELPIPTVSCGIAPYGSHLIVTCRRQGSGELNTKAYKFDPDERILKWVEIPATTGFNNYSRVLTVRHKLIHIDCANWPVEIFDGTSWQSYSKNPNQSSSYSPSTVISQELFHRLVNYMWKK